MITVQDLIDIFNKIEDKQMPIKMEDYQGHLKNPKHLFRYLAEDGITYLVLYEDSES
jgi:hypothetical protein